MSSSAQPAIPDGEPESGTCQAARYLIPAHAGVGEIEVGRTIPERIIILVLKGAVLHVTMLLPLAGTELPAGISLAIAVTRRPCSGIVPKGHAGAPLPA